MSVTSAAPSAETCVLRYALERHAATRRNDVYAVFEEGGGWTFAETLVRVRATAAGLPELAVVWSLFYVFTAMVEQTEVTDRPAVKPKPKPKPKAATPTKSPSTRAAKSPKKTR